MFIAFQNEEAWSTALVITILRKRFDDAKAEWTLIEAKAMAWLQGQKLESRQTPSVLAVHELLVNAVETLIVM